MPTNDVFTRLSEIVSNIQQTPTKTKEKRGRGSDVWEDLFSHHYPKHLKEKVSGKDALIFSNILKMIDRDSTVMGKEFLTWCIVKIGRAHV